MVHQRGDTAADTRSGGLDAVRPTHPPRQLTRRGDPPSGTPQANPAAEPAGVTPDARRSSRSNPPPSSGQDQTGQGHATAARNTEHRRLAHHKMAGRFATLCIEVLGGQRPPGQLATLTTPEVQIVLGRMARHRGLSRPHLRNWHTAAPTAGVLEVCARLAVGPRSRALALRLEHHPSSEHDTPRPDPRSREGDSAATPGAAAPRTRYRLDARRGGTPRNDIFHGWRCVALQLG